MIPVEAPRALPPRRLIVARRRGPFGLDAPRAPDLGRTEAAILHWLSEHLPDVVPLRVLPAQDEPDAAAGCRPRMLALLLPGACVALLRLEAPGPEPGPDTLALAVKCRKRRVPLSIVGSLEEARQALRRLGFEPQDR